MGADDAVIGLAAAVSPLGTVIIITAAGYTTGWDSFEASAVTAAFIIQGCRAGILKKNKDSSAFERRRELCLCDGMAGQCPVDGIPVCGWLGDVHVNGIQPEHIPVRCPYRRAGGIIPP